MYIQQIKSKKKPQQNQSHKWQSLLFGDISFKRLSLTQTWPAGPLRNQGNLQHSRRTHLSNAWDGRITWTCHTTFSSSGEEEGLGFFWIPRQVLLKHFHSFKCWYRLLNLAYSLFHRLFLIWVATICILWHYNCFSHKFINSNNVSSNHPPICSKKTSGNVWEGEVQQGEEICCLKSYRRAATRVGTFLTWVQIQEFLNWYPEKLMAATANCRKQKHHNIATELISIFDNTIPFSGRGYGFVVCF